MRTVDVATLTQNIKEMCIEANHFLSEDMKTAFTKAEQQEKAPLGKQILQQLQQNMDIAGKDMIPICQDTGMAVVFLEVGQDVHLTGGNVEDAVNEIAKITGQKPSITYARKSVANFKVREGEPLGARVTLRGVRMWEFLDRFINITAPNIRDFRGLPYKSFDGNGNYAIGISDQSIFPEIELDQIKRQIGFDIIFVTSAPTDDEGRDLLRALGVPMREAKKAEETQTANA